MNPILMGGALGALAMYFLDPHEGRRRRARTRDKALHAGRVLNEAGKVTMRDTTQRARGLVAGARKIFDHQPVSDDVLVGRVRAELGRYVSHSHAIEVHAEGGHVTLSGPILAREVRPLLKCVRRVPGVRAVSDRLTVYESAEHVSALQGGHPAPGSRFELLQENWSPAARFAAGTVGAGLLLSAMRGSSGFFRTLAYGAGGAALLARAATNRSVAALLGMADASRGIVVQKTLNVQAPVSQVYRFWTNFENYPRFMRNVREVKVQGNRSHWVVAGPAGVPVRWDAELVESQPESRLSWRSTPDSPVRHEGTVRFEPNGHGGTRITVRLSYLPPAGAVGHAIASLFGADPKSEMDSDLLRMKTMIETGRPPHDAAQPMHRES